MDAFGDPGVDNGVTVGLADPQSAQGSAFGALTIVKGGRVVVGFPASVLADSSKGQGADDFLFAYVAHEGEHITQAKKWLNSDPFITCGNPYDPTDFETESAAYWVMVSAIRGNKNYSNLNDNIEPSPSAPIWTGSWLKVDYNTMKANVQKGIEQHLRNIGRTQQNAVPAFPGNAIVR